MKHPTPDKDWVLRSEDSVETNIAAFPANRWYPCRPLLCTYEGTRFYLGSAAFVRADGVAIIRTIHQGAPHETSNDVLRATIEKLPKDPPQ